MPTAPITNIADLTCREIGNGLRLFVQRTQGAMFGLTFALVAWEIYKESPFAIPIAKILIGALVLMQIWIRQRNAGLPLLLVIALQVVFVYGLPLASGHEDLKNHSAENISKATTEVLIYCIMLALGWSVGVRGRAKRSVTVWTYRFADGNSSQKLVNISIILLIAALGYKMAEMAGLMNPILQMLPNGVSSILQTITDALSLGGSLMGGFAIGNRAMKQTQWLIFWTSYWLLFILLISGYLLSAATGIMCSMTLGLLIGRQKLPLVFMLCLSLVCAFYNFTKFEMRGQYWSFEYEVAEQTLADVPERFTEWTQLSLTRLFDPEERKRERNESNQSLSNRVNNLSILLFVQDATTTGGIPFLRGETYTLIPQLLIPRVFWKDKPRAHAGQELLNVHFRRQTLAETFRTYIAWGLLAEAYGNFGPIWGALLLGLAMGWIIGRVELFSQPFSLKSLQAFLVLTLMVTIGTSFEMVASVFVTSTFQLMVAITATSYFLVSRTRITSQSNPSSSPTNNETSDPLPDSNTPSSD